MKKQHVFVSKVLKGSNRCGRIEHLQVAGQTGADMARVEELMKTLPLEYVELEPGKSHIVFLEIFKHLLTL